MNANKIIIVISMLIILVPFIFSQRDSTQASIEIPQEDETAEQPIRNEAMPDVKIIAEEMQADDKNSEEKMEDKDEIIAENAADAAQEQIDEKQKQGVFGELFGKKEAKETIIEEVVKKEDARQVGLNEEEKDVLEKEIDESKKVHEEYIKKEEELKNQDADEEVKKIEQEILTEEVKIRALEDISEKAPEDKIEKDFGGEEKIETSTEEIRKRLEEKHDVEKEEDKITGQIEDKESVKEKIEEPGIIVDTELEKEETEATLFDISKHVLKKEKAEKLSERLDKVKISEDRINKEIVKINKEIEEEIAIIEQQIEALNKNYQETSKNLNIEKVASFQEIKDEKTGKKENLTIVTVSIKPTKTLFNISIYEEIPKNIASNIDEIVFFSTNYEVIEPDPLVLWTFQVISADTQLSYGINKKLNTELLNEIKTIPLTGRIYEEKSYGQEGSSSFRFIFPISIITLIALAVFLFNKFSHKEGGSYNEKERIDAALKKLTIYIENNLARGVKEDYIKLYLLKKGWPKSLVNEAFDKVKD